MIEYRLGARLRAILTIGAVLAIAGIATPATAKSYLDSGSGVWDGYKNGVYEGRAKSARRKIKSIKTVKRAKAAYGKKKRYAALGSSMTDGVMPRKSITGGGGVRWVASASCLNGTLRSVVYAVASNYGSVTVSSTCRSRGRNAAVGGAKRSQHLSGNAVDFRVHGNVRAAYAYLAGAGRVGGFKHYGGGLFHVDTGPRRTW